jgi:hypothetical protein
MLTGAILPAHPFVVCQRVVPLDGGDVVIDSSRKDSRSNLKSLMISRLQSVRDEPRQFETRQGNARARSFRPWSSTAYDPVHSFASRACVASVVGRTRPQFKSLDSGTLWEREPLSEKIGYLYTGKKNHCRLATAYGTVNVIDSLPPIPALSAESVSIHTGTCVKCQ